MNVEAVLFDPNTNRFFVLNDTGSFLWSQLSEPTTAQHLAGQISKSFDSVESAVALPDVEEVLKQMLSHQIVVEDNGLETTEAAKAPATQPSTEARAEYKSPSIQVMNESELLQTFQMTAAKISAAGCWWTTCVPTA